MCPGRTRSQSAFAVYPGTSQGAGRTMANYAEDLFSEEILQDATESVRPGWCVPCVPRASYDTQQRARLLRSPDRCSQN